MSEADLKEPAKAKAGTRAPAEAVEHALRSAIDAHGPEAFYAGDALEVFLSRRCPEAGNDIALLRIGLDEQIPQALVAVHAAQDLDALARQLQQRLSVRRSLNRYAAAWVVKTWIDALRLRSETIAPVAPAAVPPAVRPERASSAVPTPSRAPRVTSTGAPPAARASILPSSVGPARWIRIGVAIAAMVVITIAILFESRMSSVAPATSDTVTSALEVVPDPKPSVAPIEGSTAPAKTMPEMIASVTLRDSAAAEQPVGARNAERDGGTPPTAVAPSPRGAPACTRTTCGSVVAVHESGPGAQASGGPRPNYEIIVRMDDRAIHTFRQPTMLKAGARARVVDGKLLVLNAAPPARMPYREGRLVPESEPAVAP